MSNTVNPKKIAVLGLGRIGHNTAALLVKRGFEVTGFTRDEEKAKAVNEYGITVSGLINGNFKVKATTNIDEAIKDARFLVVTTLAKGHKPIAQMLSGKLQEGQEIFIMTGNWGAYEFYSVLKDELKAKNIIVGETSGNLAGSPKLDYPATTFMQNTKTKMSYATIPASAAPQAVKDLEQAFPELYPVKNILDTSMNNTNPPVHVPFAIFNITRMCNEEDIQFYGGTVPPLLLDFTMAADAERCAVTKAVGGDPKTILELMNTAWEVHYDDIKTLGLNTPGLQENKLPKSPYHRFLTEDVPYGFLAFSRLGKKYGVPTPRIDMLCEAYKYLLADKADMGGPDFDVDFSEVI